MKLQTKLIRAMHLIELGKATEEGIEIVCGLNKDEKLVGSKENRIFGCQKQLTEDGQLFTFPFASILVEKDKAVLDYGTTFRDPDSALCKGEEKELPRGCQYHLLKFPTEPIKPKTVLEMKCGDEILKFRVTEVLDFY